jgi:uncharacterized protein YbjQ (UPF0145 family)
VEEIEPLAANTPSGWYANPVAGHTARYWDGMGWTDKTRSDVPVRPIPTPEQVDEFWQRGADNEQWRSVIITTSHELAGCVVREHRAEVFGITVRSRNMFSDFGAGIRNLVGGEAAGYTRMLTDGRREALDRLRQEAAANGGNAVISMRMTANEVQEGMTELVAYGAAVRVEEIPSGALATEA